MNCFEYAKFKNLLIGLFIVRIIANNLINEQISEIVRDKINNG